MSNTIDDRVLALAGLVQALAQVRLAYWQNQVTLYKALGGGAQVPPT